MSELDNFVNQVKSIANKYGFDCDFTQNGEWYQFRFAGERQLFFLNMEDTRNYYPTHHSSYEVLGFDIEDFVREVNRQVRLAELSLDYNSWEDVVKRHQGRKDIDECARDNGRFIRNVSKELKALAKQYGATNVKDSKQLKDKDMKQIKDGYDTLGGYEPKFGRGDIVITDHDYTPREIVDMRVQNHRYEYMLEGTSGWWSEWQLVLVESNSYIHDSEKVEDMIKPAHLRGYAEKKRAKRREKAEEIEEAENEKQEVNDSQKVKDSDMSLAQQAVNNLREAKYETGSPAKLLPDGRIQIETGPEAMRYFAKADIYVVGSEREREYAEKEEQKIEKFFSEKARIPLKLISCDLGYEGSYEESIEDMNPNHSWGESNSYTMSSSYISPSYFLIFEVAEGVSDSKQIKDAEDIVPLDGLLMIAFKDGQEEEGFNAVKQHANESNELDGVKYETYDVNEQDGVTIVDMCAVTNDANAFVKVLLKEWGVIDAVADLDFKKSEEMQEAQENVSDSKKVKDNWEDWLKSQNADLIKEMEHELKQLYSDNISIQDYDSDGDYLTLYIGTVFYNNEIADRIVAKVEQYGFDIVDSDDFHETLTFKGREYVEDSKRIKDSQDSFELFLDEYYELAEQYDVKADYIGHDNEIAFIIADKLYIRVQRDYDSDLGFKAADFITAARDAIDYYGDYYYSDDEIHDFTEALIKQVQRNWV